MIFKTLPDSIRDLTRYKMQESPGKKWQTNVFHQFSKMLTAILRVVLDPSDDALVHLLLAGDGDRVARDESGHLESIGSRQYNLIFKLKL